MGSDILTGQDFFITEPLGEVIITNPPYSQKNKWLERCYKLKIPFALLLPINALESERRQKLYREYGVELLVLTKRMHFENSSGKKTHAWFGCAWFCYNILPAPLIFQQ